MVRRTSRQDSVRGNSTFLGAVVVLVVAGIFAIPYSGPVPLVIVILAVPTAWILVHRMFSRE